MDTNVQSELINELRNRTAEVSILGLGYVGLPLAVVFAEAGFHVVGIDPDHAKWRRSGEVKAISRMSRESRCAGWSRMESWKLQRIFRL